MVHKRRRLASLRDTVLSRTGDQVDDYLVLCIRYNEAPTCDSMGPNPHSAHADRLRARAMMEDGDPDSRDTQEFVRRK